MNSIKWIILTLSALSVRLSGEQVIDLKSDSINTSTRLPSGTIIDSNIANSVNNFGYKLLLNLMNERKNDNIVISPTGIAGLLAMALLGSVGRTSDEIAEALGFSQDIFINRNNHQELGRLLQSLNTNVTSKTLYADAIFLDAQTPLRELYRNYLHDVYHGEILSTDFQQSQEAKQAINEWVKNHTEGQIDNFLKTSLPASTKLVMLSALYFKGQWKTPFKPEYTAKMPFKTVSNEVIADLMLNFGNFPYTISKQNDFVMLALPYNDSETTMYALKPLSSKTSLSELMNKIDYNIIDNAISELASKICVIRFPKMELNNSLGIENGLKSIGIKDMFIPHKANFALMVNGNMNKNDDALLRKIENRFGEESRGVKDMLEKLPNPGIYVDSVMHDVKMSVNEYGTEAVAATSAVLARTAELFYADSPFYLFIRNDRTKLVTFSAVIFDPTT